MLTCQHSWCRTPGSQHDHPLSMKNISAISFHERNECEPFVLVCMFLSHKSLWFDSFTEQFCSTPTKSEEQNLHWLLYAVFLLITIKPTQWLWLVILSKWLGVFTVKALGVWNTFYWSHRSYIWYLLSSFMNIYINLRLYCEGNPDN